MEFIPSVDTYQHDVAAQQLWKALSETLGDRDGIAYYKHPVMTTGTAVVPDIAFIAREYRPHVFIVLNHTLEEITTLNEESWIIDEKPIDSPILTLEDLCVTITARMDKVRMLRSKQPCAGAIYFPHVSRSDFESKFPHFTATMSGSTQHLAAIWSDRDCSHALATEVVTLSDGEWRAAKSVFQGVNVLTKNPTEIVASAQLMGDAIRLLEKEIALLDSEQHRVAVQMAPGPQRIRGLAGTGKTIVLAMKAANIHRRYPEKKILFTFNTQSLYNQAKKLIARFYREYSDEDPNWDNLHLRHGWGSRARPGVYSDVCRQQGVLPMTFTTARARNDGNPFAAACAEALKGTITPTYDYILVDEAQDFPREYFRLLARLVDPEHRTIYFAYDELQSLTSVEIPSAEELFGHDSEGKPFIDLDGEYLGGIEKDFVLHKSYRCPADILLLAHGVGLGIHGPKGCVQMLRSRESWNAVGYHVEAGDFATGSRTVLFRPPENSPNRIREIYTGDEPGIEIAVFRSRDEELEAIAESIKRDIETDKVHPEHIVVISLDSPRSKQNFLNLQRRLHSKGVRSSIPGLVDQSWEFAEEGLVTLSTVFRAKGNEAPIVYICCMEALYSYVEEIESRNRAFAAISRAKAWLRVSGVGAVMAQVASELQKILADIPRLRFTFPDMEDIRIRKLDATETTRRKKEVNVLRRSIKTVLDGNADALRENPELLEELLKKITEVKGERS